MYLQKIFWITVMKKTNYNLKRTPSLEARRYDLKRNPGLKIRNVLSVVKLNKNIGEILLSLVQHKTSYTWITKATQHLVLVETYIVTFKHTVINLCRYPQLHNVAIKNILSSRCNLYLAYIVVSDNVFRPKFAAYIVTSVCKTLVVYLSRLYHERERGYHNSI